jgi:hypothetical protein
VCFRSPERLYLKVQEARLLEMTAEVRSINTTKEKNMASGHAFMDTLGAAVAEIKATVETESFLEDADKLKNISPAQKALLETVGAAFAAANFFAHEDIASDFEVNFRFTKDTAQLRPGERLHFNRRKPGENSFSIDVIPDKQDVQSSLCCLMWKWDPVQKKLVCVTYC